jgi:hypothetical protein
MKNHSHEVTAIGLNPHSAHDLIRAERDRIEGKVMVREEAG